jgi:plasmid stabilization system protein ParE
MALVIKLTPTAFNDLQKAIDYYNEQQKGLGKKFDLAIKETLLQLKKVPKAGSFMYSTVRFRVLKQFPFIILYELTENKTIIVYRIFHTSLNPYWE